MFYKVLAYLKKDLAENQDALLRATEEMGNNGKILEGWMKLNTNSSTFFSIISVTGEDENTNGNS